MNLARFIIEGSVGGVSPASDRGFDAVHGEALAFRLEEGVSNLIRSFHVQVYSPSNPTSPRASKDAPLLSLVGETTGQHVKAVTAASDITTGMPGSGVHSWIVVATVNGGLDANGNPSEDLRFSRLVVIRTEGGARKIVVGETTEYSAESWPEAFNDIVDAGPVPDGSVGVDTLGEELSRTLFGVTPAPTELYVNGSTGNDANAGSSGFPIATLTEAWRRIGTKVRASCVVRIMATGTYDASAFAVRRDFGPYLVDFIADPATATVVDTGTVTAATYQQVTAAAESWTVDAYAGLTLRVTSGAMVGEARTIIANAATTALLSDGFPTNLSAGNTFSVVRPGVILSFPAYGVLQGDSRAYVSIQGCELSWPDNSALYMVGLTYLVGVTALAGSTTNSKWIQGNGGAPYCSYANGFGWRRNGTVPAGEISVNTLADFTLAGRLGRVLLNNCAGVGHSAGVSILGRLTLDSTSSDLAVGLQGWGGNYPEVLLDDLGGAVSQGPFWMLGGRAEINGPMRLEGSGAAAERFALRDQAFVELTRAAAAGYVDIALGSELRIASGNDGGFDSVFVDGVNALTATPVAVTFGASGDAFIGEQGSVARRD